MMTVGSVNGTMLQGAGDGMQAGGGMQMDSVSRNIQNQIAAKQKKLQELSSNEDMTLEEKMKKRQEIQQEITSLRQQLRQHQMELRKEQQSKSSARDDRLGENGKAGEAGSDSGKNGLSQAGMQAVISADASLKQAKIQGSVASRMEGRAGVLKAEIKQDAGKNTEAKEAELAEVEQKAANATAAQMNTLSDADKAVKEAAEAETADKKTADKKATDKKTADKKTTDKKTDSQNENRLDGMDRRNIYTPVDVRL